MGTQVSLDGALVDPDKAVISVFDRGFLYGDSVYEVMRAYRGVPFELEAHLARLEGSARRIGMALPVSLEAIAAETKAALVATGHDEAYVRIIVTRGAGPIGLDPNLAVDPHRIVIAMPVSPPPASVYQHGAHVVLTSVRRNLRDAIDPRAKTGNYLNSVMAMGEAKERGAFEAIMLDHRDFVTEGASSNVFAVVKQSAQRAERAEAGGPALPDRDPLDGGVVLTPPLEAGILEGVTRAAVMKLARKSGILVLEVPLTEPALKQAEEVFITSSIREVVPIVKVDDVVIGSGKPGATTQKIRALFGEYVASYVSARK
jgi:branched-chain amino acid aminotransferase